MNRALALVALVLLAAACKTDASQLPDGSYAGSTVSKQAVTLDISGGAATFDGHKTKRGAKQTFVLNHLVISCKQAPEHELTCVLSAFGHSETVQLMRL